MVTSIVNPTTTDIIYPDRDGLPLSDNTKQFRWIVTIKENLELIYAQDANVLQGWIYVIDQIRSRNLEQNPPTPNRNLL